MSDAATPGARPASTCLLSTCSDCTRDRCHRGTGLIGSKAAAILRPGGHEAVAASPKSGVNSITGGGLPSLRP
jgi:hypothetical protein